MIMNNNVVQKPLYIPQINRIAAANRAYVESVEMDTNPHGAERRAQFLQDQTNMRRFGYLFSGAIARHLKGSERSVAETKVRIIKTQKELKELQADALKNPSPEKTKRIADLQDSLRMDVLTQAPMNAMGGIPPVETVVHDEDALNMLSVARENADAAGTKDIIEWMNHGNSKHAEAMYEEYVANEAEYTRLQEEIPKVDADVAQLELDTQQANDQADTAIDDFHKSYQVITENEQYKEKQTLINNLAEAETIYESLTEQIAAKNRELEINAAKEKPKGTKKLNTEIKNLTIEKEALRVQMENTQARIDTIDAGPAVSLYLSTKRRADRADANKHEVARRLAEIKQTSTELREKARKIREQQDANDKLLENAKKVIPSLQEAKAKPKRVRNLSVHPGPEVVVESHTHNTRQRGRSLVRKPS